VKLADTNFTTGAFAFDHIFVGKFTWRPSVSSARIRSPSTDSFRPPAATVNVELRLQATSKIQGTVFQPDGVTPVGANVPVRYKSSAFKQVCATNGNLTIGNTTVEAGSCKDIPQGIQDETVITDATGHYLLPLVNAGSFHADRGGHVVGPDQDRADRRRDQAGADRRLLDSSSSASAA